MFFRSRRRSRSNSVDYPKKKSKKSDRDRSKDREKKKKRHKSRSRSKSRERREEKRNKDKRRSKSREKEREREKPTHKEKSRERELKFDPPISSSREAPKVIIKSSHSEVKEEKFDQSKFDKDEEQKRLETEMLKRKERIERWRAERKKKDMESSQMQKKPETETPSSAKKWSLEDEEEDDEVVIEIQDSPKKEDEDEKTEEKIVADTPEEKNGKKVEEEAPAPPVEKMEVEEETPKVEEEEEEDIDPLDAYMREVDQEVRKINKMSKPTSSAKTSGVLVVTGNAKAKSKELKKGELIEQNQDGLEYSSEEEMEDIKDTAANLATKQKKELPKIDHSKVEYSDFRKNFYVEVPEISRMTPEEVEVYKTELEGIQVKGKGCPKPIRTWAQCGVSKKEMDTLKKLGFEKPTPIQCQAIPAIMSGRDLIGIAKTGSGKFLNFDNLFEWIN